MKIYSVPKDDTPKEKAKCWLKNRWTDAKCFWDENKEAIIVLTPIVVGGITAVTKVAGKRINLHKEKVLKDLRIYDTRLGHYWELRRKLTNTEWAEIERRWLAGEGYGQILSDMGVLRK